MHLNKLSTAALMRLSILASLDLLLARIVGYWQLLHPLFFLIVVTLNLGLYAVMVYSGTLNRTLIAMMLVGLAGVLVVIAFGGLGPSAFTYGGPYHWLASGCEELTTRTFAMFPRAGLRPPPKRFWWAWGVEVAYGVVDVAGLGLIISAGGVARALRARSARRGPSTDLPCP